MHTYTQVIIQKGTTNTTELWFRRYYICAGEKHPQRTKLRSRNRVVFSRFFDFRGNLGNVEEKPARKEAPSSTHLPSKSLPGGISLKSTESLLYFHEK